MKETEVYGQLVIRNFLIQQIISCYEFFYIILSGVIGTILNKMIAPPLLRTSKLNDPLSSATVTQQQTTTGNNTTSKSTTIILNNQETDYIDSRYPFINNINKNVNYNPRRYSSLFNKRNLTISSSRDVIDNKTDNFLTPPFCNIKRMSEGYCNENERLKTFRDWPLDFIDKEILAKTGFFFTGDEDKVKCYFCEVEIGRWERNDNPISEHTRWSPNCPLIRRRQTNNVPIDVESLNRLLPPISYDVCGANDIIEVRPNAYAEGSISSLSPIGSPINSLPNTPNSVTATTQTSFLYPDHPEYAIESARLRSFGEWPRNMKQKPEQLSEAGFFYTGIGDRVKCFSCGGGLKDWDENDDPWEQHALWLGNCHYLKLMKGIEYVQAVAEKFKTAEENHEEEEQQESKELGTNENKTEQQIENNFNNSSTGNNSNNNSSNYDEVPNVASTSSTTSPVKSIVKAAATSTKTAEQSNTNNNNNSNINSSHQKNNCNNCSSATSSSSSDEENGSATSTSSTSSPSSSLSSGSGSTTSVNSNSSKEAETVCKQPKLDCHHHHISRDLHHEKKSITISEEKLCKICYAAEYNTAFLPCGHVVACAKCASSVTKCPMCRKPFTDVMRVYFS